MATASATAAVPGLTPPPVSSPSSRNSSPVKRAVLTTVANSADADRSVDGDRDGGMQFLSAVVGSAAVGTVLWSEFVLKETGGHHISHQRNDTGHVDNVGASAILQSTAAV